MDFLDSLDLNVSKNKTRRVRSWYLYEQFKSLERNQLDATRKLKSRSTQDRILRQELTERKARRTLYNQFGTSQSESGFESSLKSESTKKTLNEGSDDFFQSFHELQEDEGLDACSDDNNSQTGKFYDDDFKSADEPDDNQSFTESVNSVVDINHEETLADDNKYIENENKTKFEDMEVNFDVIKEKLQCLKRLSQMRDINKFSDTEDSPYSNEDDKIKQIMKKNDNENTSDNNIYFMWSKLVSFAYQIMQLNHGNCYYDYGSQLLTAVLACDVLRRGISRMSHILQPYVSPIKYATNTGSSTETHQNLKRKNSQRSEQSKRSHEYKRYYPNHRLTNPRTKFERTRRYRSNNICEQHSSPFTVMQNKINCKKYSWASEPGQRISKLRVKYPTSKWSYSTLWPSFSGDSIAKNSLCTCSCHKVVNPMLRLSRYLDRIMSDMDDPLFI